MEFSAVKKRKNLLIEEFSSELAFIVEIIPFLSIFQNKKGVIKRHKNEGHSKINLFSVFVKQNLSLFIIYFSY